MWFLRTSAETLFWTIAALATLGWTVLVGAAIGLPLLAILGPLTMLLALVLVAQIVRSIRNQRATLVLSYVEQAVRLNLPLPALLRNAESGLVGRRLNLLRSRLEEGQSLAVAMEQTVPEIPERILRTTAAAERLGKLAPALRRLVEQQRHRHRRRADGGNSLFLFAYPAFMLLFTTGVISLVGTFVIPKYEQIFLDFAIPLPAVTRHLLTWNRSLADLLLLLALVIIIISAGQLLRVIVQGSISGRRPSAIDRLLWRVPILHGILRDRGLGDSLALAADALDAGQPLPLAIRESAEVSLNAVLRHRMLDWADHLEAGAGASAAAAQARLPALVTSMIATAQTGQAMTDVLRFLSRYFTGRHSRAAILLAASLVPAVVLVVGGLVLAIAAGLFIPMIRLMDAVNPGEFGGVF